MTVSPWDKNPELFKSREKDRNDQFRYTRILFSTQDVFLQVLERGIGRDAGILIPVLDYIDEHKPLSRAQIRGLMKELNLIASVRNISLLDRSEIDGLLASINVAE